MVDLHQEFSNVTSFLEFLRTPTTAEQASDDASDRRDSESTRWTKTPSREAAIELAERGWQDGIKRIENLSATLSEEIIKILYVPEVHFDVSGDQLDMGRFVNGEPEDFMTLVSAEIELEPRILHLQCNVTASWNVDTETMIRKGAAVVALVYALEKHGKRVIVDVVGKTSTRSGSITTIVRIKDSNGPVNLANLVFFLAHPSTLRRLIFAAWEHEAFDVRQKLGIISGLGYGRVGELDQEEREDIYVQGMDSYIRKWGADEAVPWILAQLGNQGIYTQREVEA